MNVNQINEALSRGETDRKGLFPRLEELRAARIQFDMDFGLKELPTQPGILIIRGPRQFGKSTWLEQQLLASVEQFGPSSSFYINGDSVANVEQLYQQIVDLSKAFNSDAGAKRIFIDEITSVRGWQNALKRTADEGILINTLVVTTGSSATDLRRGAELLPGRKGKLNRTKYFFTQLSYQEFCRQAKKQNVTEDLIYRYILSGGSPLAANYSILEGYLPSFIIELTREWVYGEIAKKDRSRGILLAILEQLCKYGGSRIGYAKLARESGIANNTVAAGYIELLTDLMTVAPALFWDKDKKVALRRKECKFHFINLLAAVSFHPANIRSVQDLKSLKETQQAVLLEWLVASELCRRACITGKESPESLFFWASKKHEIDFVTLSGELIEVKKGSSCALEFSWFLNDFVKDKLEVICTTPFKTEQISGTTLEDFLLESPPWC